MAAQPVRDAFSDAAAKRDRAKFVQQAAITLLPLIAEALGQKGPDLFPPADAGTDEKA